MTDLVGRSKELSAVFIAEEENRLCFCVH